MAKAKPPTAKQAKTACSRMWSKLIRRKGYCEAKGILAGECTEQLQAAHILPRSRATRVAFHPGNGLCLCSKHHIMIDRNPGWWHELMVELNMTEVIKSLQREHDELIYTDLRTHLMIYREELRNLCTRTVCMTHNLPVGPQCRCMGPKRTEYVPCQRSCRMWGAPAVNGTEEEDVPNGRPRNHGRPLYVDAHAQIREWRVDFAQPDLDTRFCETLGEVIEAIIEHGLNGITVTTIFDLYDNETLLESVEHRVPPASLRRLFVDHHLIT